MKNTTTISGFLRSFINFIVLIFLCSVVLSSCSSATLINKGWKQYKKANYSKAANKFTKAIAKDGNIDGYEGRAFTKLKLGMSQDALNDIQQTMSSPKANYTYSAAKIAAQSNNKALSFEYLCHLYTKSDFNRFIAQSRMDSDFEYLHNTAKFERYLNGYRRIKLSINEGHVNWNEQKLALFSSAQDQFCIVSAVLSDGNAIWYLQHRKLLIITMSLGRSNT